MGMRRASRVQEKIKARIFGLDHKGKPFSAMVETLDVSQTGARVSGVTQFEGPGDTVGLEANGKKSRFAVVWVGRRGSKLEAQAGLRILNPQARFWAVELPTDATDRYRAQYVYDPSRSSGVLNYLERRDDRRSQKRVSLRAGATIRGQRNESGWGFCTDITTSGCFIETAKPASVQTRVELLIRFDDRELLLRGIVRNSKPQKGIGIEFVDLLPEEKKFLERMATPKSKFASATAEEE